jgi:hypothetical protein
MKAPAKTFGSPEGEPNTTTNSPTPQQMCEKLWTLPSVSSKRRWKLRLPWAKSKRQARIQPQAGSCYSDLQRMLALKVSH